MNSGILKSPEKSGRAFPENLADLSNDDERPSETNCCGHKGPVIIYRLGGERSIFVATS